MPEIIKLKNPIITIRLKAIIFKQTLVLEDRIIEVPLLRKDIHKEDVRIAITTMQILDNQIEPMEMAREDNTIMKTKMKSIPKITIEDKELKEDQERLFINLEITVKIFKQIILDLEEIKTIMKTTMNIRELLLSTARLSL